MDPDLYALIANMGQDGTQPTNVLQAMPQAMPQPAPDAQQAPMTNVLQLAAQPPQPAPPQIASTPAPTEQPHKRHSVLDTIGRIADVVARVGGAEALYQPTLDAREDRAIAAGDHARKVDTEALQRQLTEQQIAAGALQPEIDARKRLGTALGALTGRPNAAELWPAVAAQAGIDPTRTAAIGQILTQNPDAAGIFAKALGADTDNLGKNVFFGTTNDGKTVAYQVGPDGHPHILDFGGQVTPSDPIKVVDTGGSNVVIGSGGNVKKILPNTAKPDTVLTTTTSTNNNIRDNKTKVIIAGMPARSKDGAGGKAGADDGNVLTLLDNIQSGFGDLHNMQALPGEGSGIGQIEGAIGRSALGQKFGEQVGNAAAQKRLEIAKNVSALQQAMLKSLPASATRTKFEQEMLARGLPDPSKMSYSTAQTVIRQLRESYQAALAASKKSTTPVRTAPKIQPHKGNGGWSVVKVQ